SLARSTTAKRIPARPIATSRSTQLNRRARCNVAIAPPHIRRQTVCDSGIVKSRKSCHSYVAATICKAEIRKEPYRSKPAVIGKSITVDGRHGSQIDKQSERRSK